MEETLIVTQSLPPEGWGLGYAISFRRRSFGARQAFELAFSVAGERATALINVPKTLTPQTKLFAWYVAIVGKQPEANDVEQLFGDLLNKEVGVEVRYEIKSAGVYARIIRVRRTRETSYFIK